MDKQSLANLLLNLKQMEVVDNEAVIDQLHIPKGEEIKKRMNQKEEAVMKAKSGGGQAPSMPGPEGILSQMKRGNQ